MEETHFIRIGILHFYTFTQGTQFLGLFLLPAVSVSLMLNFTPLIVAIMGIAFLNEKPTLMQWSGAILFIMGIIFYFHSVSFSGNQGIGLAHLLCGTTHFAHLQHLNQV